MFQQNKIYVMHYAVADDNEEQKNGLVFISELPDWWQSMSFQYFLFQEELPEEIVMLHVIDDDKEEEIVFKRNDNVYQNGDVMLKVMPYNTSNFYKKINPHYVGKLDFPSDVKACWVIQLDYHQMDKLILEEGRFITGFSLYIDSQP